MPGSMSVTRASTTENCPSMGFDSSSFGEAKHHVGDLRVDHVLACEHPQIEVGLLESELRCCLDEIWSVRQLAVSLFRRRLVGERQLQDVALLGDVELLLVAARRQPSSPPR